MSRVISGFAQFFDGEGDPLSNGWLKFLVSGTNNTLKNTYADIDQTIPNANPLQLDAEGRAPNIFGQGYYKVILYENNPVTGLPGAVVKTVDPVVSDFSSVADGTIGNFAEWDSETVYQVAQIVIFNTKYYRSITGGNLNNQPDINLDDWEEVDFLRNWNTNVTYFTDDVAVYSGGMYFSLADANQGNQPDVSTAWWNPVGSGTILLNWEESGTSFRPILDGYDLGDSGHAVGTAYINNLGSFTLTPSALPTLDYHIANKLYIDNLDALNMKWKGEWVPGDIYNEFDVVTDSYWLMIANKTTDERPAPHPVGEKEWVRDIAGDIPFLETSATDIVLYAGQRYTFPGAYFISNLRIWIPASATGIHVMIWAIDDPTGPDKQFINLFPGADVPAEWTGKWYELPLGEYFIGTGQTVDIIMSMRSNTGETSFTHEWDYSVATGDPPPGDIYHQESRYLDQIRIHAQDTSLIDRSASLDNLSSGSKMEMDSSGYIWTIITISKTGDVYTAFVEPEVSAKPGTSDFQFTYFGSISISYVYNTDFFTSLPNVSGYFSNEYDPDNPAHINQNGYGIDIKVQSSTSSDDWDVMSQPTTGGGGGGGDATTLSGYYASDFALKAENETISGDWIFTGDQSFAGDLTRNDSPVYTGEHGGPPENPVINGRFDVWQRGTSFNSDGWTADHFYAGSSGATIACSQQTFTPGQTDVPREPKYFYRINATVADDLWFLMQPIEDVRSYAGQQITVAVYMKANTTLSCNIQLRQDFGSGGSAPVTSLKTITLSTSWEEYFFTTTLGSISGKTIGTNSYLGLYLVQPNNTTGYFDIADIRLNRGPDILPISNQPYGDVFRECTRYYESREGDIAGYMTRSNDPFRSWDFTFATEKYKNPTITPTGSGFTPTVNAANKKSFRLYYNSGDTTTERVLTSWVAEAEITL